jgi:hypothetical protein
MSLLDFLDMVELLLLCYFYLFECNSLLSRVYWFRWDRQDMMTPLLLFTLSFLYSKLGTWSGWSLHADSALAF